MYLFSTRFPNYISFTLSTSDLLFNNFPRILERKRGRCKGKTKFTWKNMALICFLKYQRSNQCISMRQLTLVYMYYAAWLNECQWANIPTSIDIYSDCGLCKIPNTICFNSSDGKNLIAFKFAASIKCSNSVPSKWKYRQNLFPCWNLFRESLFLYFSWNIWFIILVTLTIHRKTTLLYYVLMYTIVYGLRNCDGI